MRKYGELLENILHLDMGERKPEVGYTVDNPQDQLHRVRVYYQGHLPPDCFPKGVRIRYVYSELTKEVETEVSYTSVVPVFSFFIPPYFYL